MKKILCILAIAVVSLGAFSCEADTSENDVLFETQGSDGEAGGSEVRGEG